MQKPFRLFLCVTALAAGAVVLPAQAENELKVGVLSCHVDKGWGVVFGSSRDLRCIFDPVEGPSEHYYGSVSKFGVDIGYTAGGVMVWDVVAPSAGLRPGGLEGSYGGATASVTPGVGAGINVLVGGFERSFTLQPISFEGNKGLNIAAGIGSMRLRHGEP